MNSKKIITNIKQVTTGVITSGLVALPIAAWFGSIILFVVLALLSIILFLVISKSSLSTQTTFYYWFRYVSLLILFGYLYIFYDIYSNPSDLWISDGMVYFALIIISIPSIGAYNIHKNLEAQEQ